MIGAKSQVPKMAAKLEMRKCEKETDYRQIERCIAGSGVRLDTGSGGLYEGCSCREENCSSIECSCMTTCAYDSRLLKAEYFASASRPVFECNSKCRCSSRCPNRVTQNQPLSTLQVYQTAPKAKGYGVRCTQCIPQGTFIGEYVGEIISSSEARQRLEKLSPTDSCYVMTYKEHVDGGSVLATNIDATFAGNITRYVNHSCSPNVTVVPVRDDSIVPRLCLFACREIETGQELCFSYFGCSSEDLEDRGSVLLGDKQCLCGAKNCLQFLPLQN